MKTCCPGCQTVFRVTSEQLKARAGKVRCGQCRKVFSALESLLDDSEPIIGAPLPAESLAREQAAVPSATPVTPTVAVLLRRQEMGTGAEIAAADESPAEQVPADTTPARMTADSLPDSVVAPQPVAQADWSAATPDETAGAAGNGDADGTVVPRKTRDFASYVRWPRRPFLIAIVLLVLLLVGQLAFHFRGTIVLIAPTLRPALTMLSEAFGTDIPLPRHADLVSIETSELQSEPGRNKLLALQATLRNRASYAQAYPAIELTLTDTDDKAVARRVFMPEEYLPASALADKSFHANGDVEVRLSLDAKTVNAAGYRLYVFYP